MSQQNILIVDGTTGQVVEAHLCEPITDDHVRDTQEKWKPWEANAITTSASPLVEQSAHWDWEWKLQEFGGQIAFPTFAIECDGDTQGLLITSTTESCRLPAQRGMSLIYVEYLVTAPWNRQTLTASPRYTAVGSVLMSVAFQLSFDEAYDCNGRVGLYSLPQSSKWYAEKCGMTDLGIDPHKPPLSYFETTTDQAKAFLARGA